jgi:hypothetical protein
MENGANGTPNDKKKTSDTPEIRGGHQSITIFLVGGAGTIVYCCLLHY